MTQLLVLQEFRLNAADSAGLVERIVTMWRPGSGSAVPLLTSVDDPRDVAMLRTATDQDRKDASRQERAALAPFVATWRPLQWYRARVAENAQGPPRYYRMAVTGSGINDVNDTLAAPRSDPAELPAADHIELLWIGAPVGTHAGLLVLVGHDGDGRFAIGRDISGWPLPLSRELGVRIYEGGRAPGGRTKLHRGQRQQPSAIA